MCKIITQARAEVKCGKERKRRETYTGPVYVYCWCIIITNSHQMPKAPVHETRGHYTDTCRKSSVKN